MYGTAAKTIQRVVRGYNLRKNRLPNSLYYTKNILENNYFPTASVSDDGRINSCMDETSIINILLEHIPNRIKTPEKRHWFDVQVRDFRYGWLPINIKSTSMQSADNTGNLAMCVYALTDEVLDLNRCYNNGPMSKILMDKLKNNKLNKQLKKDYYFIVYNKSDTKKIIINSYKGLDNLTGNINNLPFQVKWQNNQQFSYKNMKTVVSKFKKAVQTPLPSWREEFLRNMRDLD
tara:strand:- start:7 stop:705 length:699 start_codon:yes stop_codon:yes gene_type:complete